MAVNPIGLTQLTPVELAYFVELTHTIDTHLQSHWKPGKRVLLEMPKLHFRLIQRIIEEYGKEGWVVQDVTGYQEQITHLNFFANTQAEKQGEKEGSLTPVSAYGLLAGTPRLSGERE